MTITVTTTRIDVASEVITLSELVTAVGSLVVIELVGSVVTIKHHAIGTGTARELYLSGTTILTIDSSLSQLAWTWGATTQTANCLTVLSTAKIVCDRSIGSDFTFNFDKNATPSHYGYITFYGESDFDGNPEGDYIVLKNYRNLYWYCQVANEWNCVQLMDNTLNTGYFMYLSHADMATDAVQTFNNVIIGGVSNTNGYAIISSGGFFPNLTFNNCTFANTTYLQLSYSTIRFTNCLFDGIVNGNHPLTQECGKNVGLAYLKTVGSTYEECICQPKLFFDTCTFDGDSRRRRGFRFTSGTVAYLKNCTIQNCNVGLSSESQSVVLLNGCTFTNNVSDKSYTTGGEFLYAHTLNLLIQDSTGTPISGAVVKIRQIDGDETWTFITGADGKIYDMYSNYPIFVHYEEDFGATIYYWSDKDQVNKYHTIEVGKQGYATAYETETFEADKTKTITLVEHPIYIDRDLRGEISHTELSGIIQTVELFGEMQ